MPTPHPHQRERDTGAVTLELAIVFPALLLIITALVQYGLWFHARTLAHAAAAEGAAAARAYNAALPDGHAQAEDFLARTASDTLLGHQVTVTAVGTGHVRVTVTGHSLSVLPGITGPAVTESAEGPIERFTTAGGP
jgi:Flp pilus assembly protein TadG